MVKTNKQKKKHPKKFLMLQLKLLEAAMHEVSMLAEDPELSHTP